MPAGVDEARTITGRLWVLAIVVGLLLGGLWLRSDWAALSHGRLPDSDDMVRLAQVRDWLAGQRFGDLVQHRLGGAGAPALHWSRLGDLGPALWMIVLRPPLGAAAAEIWAAILWPVTLFVAYLGLAARLTARVAGRDHAAIGLLIAAFAFPAITMFVPGRIDHHGLQIVLTLAMADAVLCPPGWRGGAALGLAMAASLAIGLETAPFCAAAMAVLGALWVSHAERGRILAFGATLNGVTLLWWAITRPDYWNTAYCDGFTPATMVATLVAGLFWIALALVTPFLKTSVWRAAAAMALGALALLTLYHTSSPCFSGPYGSVDPLLARLWLDRVAEARGLFADDLGKGLAFGGLALAGTLASAIFFVRERTRGWGALLVFQLFGTIVMLMQVRGSALAASLAAPAMAHLVHLARARTGRPGALLALAAAWIVSAGLAWSMAGHLLSPQGAAASAALRGADCTAAVTLDQLRALPPGTMIAPMDAGAYLIGATPHRVLAAPYHRNNRGNRAAYDFWLSPPDTARAVAARWHADYVLACPDAFGGIDLTREGPGGMAMLLDRGAAPDWLVPLPLRDSAAHLYRILPASPADR